MTQLRGAAGRCALSARASRLALLVPVMLSAHGAHAAQSALLEEPGRLLVVDAAVPDADLLLEGLAGYRVLRVERGDAALDAIAAEARRLGTLSSLVIVSHGADGGLSLGGEWVDETALERHADALGGIAFADGADILLYACDVAATGAGESFVQELARMTGTDVAASSNATGSARLADWELEYTAGTVETATPFASSSLVGYSHTLSHFRGGAITWQALDLDDDGQKNDVQITVKTAWRFDDVDAVSLEAIPSISSLSATPVTNDILYVNGDSTSADYALQTSIFEAHDLDPDTSYLVRFTGCCRISSLENNADGNWYISTSIYLKDGNLAPKIDLPIIFQVPQFQSGSTPLDDWTFDIGSTDPNADKLRYRLASSKELGGSSTNPAGFSINPNTGLLTWSGSGALSAGLYSGGIVAEDVDTAGNVKSRSHVDFVLDLQPKAAVEFAPSANIPETRNIRVEKGDTFAFSLDGTAIDTQSLGDVQGALTEPTPNSYMFDPGAVGSGLLPAAYPITFEVRDSGGTGSNNYLTLNFIVPDPNAPKIENLEGDRTVYATTVSQLIDETLDATVSDADDTDLEGGFLKFNVTFTDGEYEVLGVESTGDGAGEIRVGGSDVYFGGDLIGTIDGAENGVGTALRVDFTTADATLAAVQALVRALTYEDTFPLRATGDRSLSVYLRDGAGNANAYDFFIDIQAHPTAPDPGGPPLQAANRLTIVEGATISLSNEDLAYADPDDDTITLTPSNVQHGQFELVSAPGAAIASFTQEQVTLGQIAFAHDGTETAPSYDISASDGINAATSPAPATIAFTNENDHTPAISGTPATTGNVGAAYSFTPTASDTDEGFGGTLTFAIANAPAWATFDTATGTLIGTPTIGDDAVYSGIVITVADDGGLEDALAAFSITVADPCVGDPDGAECLALDSDDDGLTNAQEDSLGTDRDDSDTDGDGADDGVETGDPADPTDTDDDGIPDVFESGTDDADGDGTPDAEDTDSDGDTIPDTVEVGADTSSPADTDSDGSTDLFDLDSDGDGIPDAIEAGADSSAPADGDSDGDADYIDTDSDGDGLPDRLEDALTGDDTDADGLDDAYDADSTAGADANGDGVDDAVAPRDSDGDATPDYLDVDSDGDAAGDEAESGVSGDDADGDGLDDALDPDETGGTDADSDGLDDAFASPDSDGDAVVDQLDSENLDPCVPAAGNAACLAFDSDGDGLTNAEEDALGTDRADTDTDGDGADDGTEVGVDTDAPLDADVDGAIDALESTAGDADADGTADESDAFDADPCLPSVGNAACLAFDSDGDGLTNADEDTLGTDRGNADTDGDGADDGTETGDPSDPTDTDGDGAPDVIESSTNDADGDGTPDAEDTDSDGDTIPDAAEVGADTSSPADTDSDGTADLFDLDSDADGIPDAIEADADPSAPADTDSDGAADYVDPDSDDDGVPDAVEDAVTGSDADSDGIDDAYDADATGGPDADANGLDDSVEPRDGDGDGVADHLDTDSDNDAISDAVEAGADPTDPVDTDGDGTPDLRDADSDADGIPDVMEAGADASSPLDTDSDGKADYVDADSDGDRLPDRLEGGATGDDTDSDGIDDVYDVDLTDGTDANGDGVDDAAEARDTDGDGTSDYRDADSDGDGTGDAAESGLSGTDADGDGLDDALDPDSTGGADGDGDGIGDDYAPLDGDGDGLADHVDPANLDPCTPDIGHAACSVFDSDDDGLTNAEEDLLGTGRDAADSDGDGADDGTEVGPDSAAPLDADGDGTPDVYESSAADADADGTPDESDTFDADPCFPLGNGVACLAFDSDADGLTNEQEADVGTDPSSPDTDGDGTGDADEIGDADAPKDSDGDGIADAFESATHDADGDGTPDAEDTDSDADGIPDATEVGPNPSSPADTDGDGDADLFDADSDADGIPDAIEGRVGEAEPDDGDGDNDGAGVPADADADGVPDYRDADSDGDGLPDRVEDAVTGDDGDGDGIDDAYDADATGGEDADGDGVDDAAEPRNRDADALPDSIDADSDDDGIADGAEAGMIGADTDGDGIDDALDAGHTGGADLDGDGIGDGYALPDSDGDGVPDLHDLDSDNDGWNDAVEAGLTDEDDDGLADPGQRATASPRDTDGDGLPDQVDVDADGDGAFDIELSLFGPLDGDGDGRIDSGPDADGDGIVDTRDEDPAGFGNYSDRDADGIPDSQDADIDNDGIPNGADGLDDDTDGDGIRNTHDLDGDNDGIADVVEAGNADVDGDGRVDDPSDADGDGLADASAFGPSTGGIPAAPRDTDGDGTPDHVDVDSDGDGLMDLAEAGGTDADGDGRLDEPVDADENGLADDKDGSLPDGAAPKLTDTDGDGEPDYRDTDSDGDGFADADEGTADSDGDGVADYLEEPGQLQTAVSGGGSMNVWVLGLLSVLVVMVRRRRGAAAARVAAGTRAAAMTGAAVALAAVLAAAPLTRAAAQDGDSAQGSRWSFGVDLGMAKLEPRGDAYVVSDDTSFGFGVSGAYRWSERWQLEAFYVDAGEARIASTNAAIGEIGGLEYRVIGAGAVYRLLRNRGERRAYPYLRAGLVHTSNSVTDSRIAYDRRHGAGLYVGAGGEMRLTGSWRLHADLTSYDQDESMLSLGLRRDF